MASRTAAGVLALAFLLMLGTPAHAWGPFTHVTVASRVSRILTPRAPWLAAQEPAFVWGAVCRGLHALPQDGLSRQALLDPALDAELERAARATGDAAGLAFALGWGLHRATEAALGPAGAQGDAAEWARDTLLWRRAPQGAQDAYRRAVFFALSPAGAGPAGLLEGLKTPIRASAAYARLNAAWLSASVDAYPAARAQSLPAAVRRGLGERRISGEIEPLLAAATRAGVASLEPRLAREPAGAPTEARRAP